MNRECLDVIILRVKNVPDYFKTFCCVLNTRSCYELMVKSLINCYSVYKNEVHIKNYIEIERLLSHFKTAIAKDKFCKISAKITGQAADSYVDSKECLFKILQEENPKFIEKFTDYLALQDCPNHLEINHHIQTAKIEILATTSSNEYLPGIKKYQEYLKRMYLDKVKIEVQDTFNSNIHQFVNLSLIKPQDQTSNNEYLKALQDPYHLLFSHKEYTSNITTPLNSLAEIFDTSGPVSQVILIQGSPGCGKTTLANKICTEWAKENLVQHYMLVILLNLRDVTISEIESIDQMVEYTMGEDFVAEIVRDITCIEGKNILLLLEGWDELPEDKQLDKSFFANIIAGKILKKGSILITSRPSSIGSIQKKFITRNVAILGFSDDQIEQYIDQCFLDSSHGPKNTLKHKFMIQLNSNLMLKSLAYIPVNLSILVYVFTQYESELPDTLTELYQQYVLLKLSLYNQRQSDEHTRFPTLDCLPDYITESLNKLCELAYGGIRNQKLYFSQNDIEKLYQPVPLDYDGMGLLQVDNYVLRRGSNKTYHFMHKTVQEFLAALHMKKVPDQNISLLQCFQNEQIEMMMFIFYAGLTGFYHLDNLELTSTCIREQVFSYSLMKCLRFITSSYRNNNCGKWLLFTDKLKGCRIFTERYNMERLSMIIACCAEAKNPSVCRAFSNSGLFHRDLCYFSINTVGVTPQLLSSLSYCIAYSGQKWYVDLNKVFSEQDVMSLQKHLIDSNNITGKLVALESKIENSNVMHLFVEKFLQPHSTLGSLSLSGSKLDDCITILSEGLRLNGSLVVLELTNCNISSKGLLSIAEMLCYNNTLQCIDLLRNRFTVKAVVEVLQMIKSNTTLRMMKVDIEIYHNKQIKQQLVLLNKKRKNPLMLHLLQIFLFGDLQRSLLLQLCKTALSIQFHYRY